MRMYQEEVKRHYFIEEEPLRVRLIENGKQKKEIEVKNQKEAKKLGEAWVQEGSSQQLLVE